MSSSSDATDIAGVDVAGPPNGQPIVFVHGAGFTRKMWGPQREALSDEFRVIAFDLPGHGDRSGETFRMEPALSLLDRVVKTVAGGHATLVGLSLGGYVSTAYAGRNPEAVDGLVIAGSSANPVRGMELATRATGGLTRLVTRSDRVEAGAERLAKRWVRQRDLPEHIEREIIESGFYLRQFGEAAPDLAGTNFRRALAAYSGPTLVINGQGDVVMRRGADDHAGAAGDATVEVLEGAGHVSNLHRPAEFTDAVRRFARRRVEPARAG